MMQNILRKRRGKFIFARCYGLCLFQISDANIVQHIAIEYSLINLIFYSLFSYLQFQNSFPISVSYFGLTCTSPYHISCFLFVSFTVALSILICCFIASNWTLCTGCPDFVASRLLTVTNRPCPEAKELTCSSPK